MKVIVCVLALCLSAFATDNVLSACYVKLPTKSFANDGITYQVMCIDWYKFLVVTRSVDSVSVTQMREINSSGNEKVMKCDSSSESK